MNVVPTNSGVMFSNQNHNEQVLDLDNNEKQSEMLQENDSDKETKIIGLITLILFFKKIFMIEGTMKGEMRNPFSSPAKNLNEEMILIIVLIRVSLQLYRSVVVVFFYS